MIKESPAPWARRCRVGWLTRLSAQGLGFGRLAGRILLWLAAHLFHERSQAVNRSLDGIDALVERVKFCLPFLSAGFERFVQFIDMLQTVANGHFRREFADGVIGEDLFGVIGAHWVGVSFLFRIQNVPYRVRK